MVLTLHEAGRLPKGGCGQVLWGCPRQNLLMDQFCIFYPDTKFELGFAGAGALEENTTTLNRNVR
jgi:hypothetical protein